MYINWAQRHAYPIRVTHSVALATVALETDAEVDASAVSMETTTEGNNSTERNRTQDQDTQSVLVVGNVSLLRRSVLWEHNTGNPGNSATLPKWAIIEFNMTEQFAQLLQLVDTKATRSRADVIVAMVCEYYLVMKGFIPHIVQQATEKYLETHENMPKVRKRRPEEAPPRTGPWNDPFKTGHFSSRFKAVKHRWNYNFAKLNNVSQMLTQTLLLEYFRIQNHFSLKIDVQMMFVFVNDPQKYPVVLDIIQTLCTTDELLYELKRTVTKRGMKQLLRHMYGMQNWVKLKEKGMLEKFKSETYTFSVIFFFRMSKRKVRFCKQAIRFYVNDTLVYNAAHYPDDPDQSLILAQVLLNENSMHYLNYGDGCHAVAKKLARRTKRPMIKSYPVFYAAYRDKLRKSSPDIYLGRTDVILGPVTTARFFQRRDKNRTEEGVSQVHVKEQTLAGKSGNTSASSSSAAGSSFVKYSFDNSAARDYFHDPRNYGYCYGMRFLHDSKSLAKLNDRAKGITLNEI